MDKETQAIIENIKRILHGWEKDYIPHQHAERLENLEKFLLSIEDYTND